jgi:alkylmercury lyase
VPVERIASTVNLSREEVRTILQTWLGVYYDDADRIVGYWGLALPKMSHLFEVNGKTLYTWCAWDGLFIPEILQSTARVESTCPVTGEKIRLTVAPDRVKQCTPRDTFVSFLTPEAARIRENVILNFCHYVYFFSSAEAGRKWSSENEGTFIVSLDEAFFLGQKKNKLQYRDLLGGKGEA